jgi:hypothetical protein
VVATGAPYSITECQRFFEEPATPRQRQYEALRAYFLEELPSEEVARNFGYSPAAFRVLCHAFRYGRYVAAKFMLRCRGESQGYR